MWILQAAENKWHWMWKTFDKVYSKARIQANKFKQDFKWLNHNHQTEFIDKIIFFFFKQLLENCIVINLEINLKCLWN